MITNNKQLGQIAQVLFKEDSKRNPTELLPLTVVFGLIAISSGIISFLLKGINNGNNK